MFDYRSYLEFSERYIQQAEDQTFQQQHPEWLLMPSILLSWIAVEFFINNMLDDFSSLPEDMFQLHERAFLLEKKLTFINQGENIGEFVLDQTEYRRLEDKIFFLIAKFSVKKDNFKGDTLWQNFEKFKDVRNKIMHPRKEIDLQVTIESAKKYLANAKDIIKFVSNHVWGKPVEV